MNNKIVEKDLSEIYENCKNIGLNQSIFLITGCAGFLGFYILNYLVKYNDLYGIKKIIGIDNFLLGKPDWLTRLEIENIEILSVHKFDIYKDNIDKISYAGNATHILHMASIASPTFYRQYPLETIDANVWGLRNLLNNSLNNKKLQKILYFSSSEVYGNPEKDSIPTLEIYNGNVATMGPRACYDEAKRFCETLCYTFSKKYGIPITIARPFNNYGPGMSLNDKRLPADFAKQVLSKMPLKIYSDGQPTRTFCYISDAIAGYLKCLDYKEFDVFNIGTSEPEISVYEFAKIFLEEGFKINNQCLEINFESNVEENYLIDNPLRRCPNIEKARIKLNYNPTVTPNEGVKRYLSFLFETKK